MNVNLLFCEAVIKPEVKWYSIVGLIGSELLLLNFFVHSYPLFFTWLTCYGVWYYFSPMKIMIYEGVEKCQY